MAAASGLGGRSGTRGEAEAAAAAAAASSAGGRTGWGSRRGRAEKSGGRWRGRFGPPGGGGDGPVRAVGAGVHPGLVRALGGRAVQRGGGEAHPQEQPELRRAGEALLPPHLGRSVPGAERGGRLVYTGRGRRRPPSPSRPPGGRGVPPGRSGRRRASSALLPGEAEPSGGGRRDPFPGAAAAGPGVPWSCERLCGGTRLPGSPQVAAQSNFIRSVLLCGTLEVGLLPETSQSERAAEGRGASRSSSSKRIFSFLQNDLSGQYLYLTLAVDLGLHACGRAVIKVPSRCKYGQSFRNINSNFSCKSLLFLTRGFIVYAFFVDVSVSRTCAKRRWELSWLCGIGEMNTLG